VYIRAAFSAISRLAPSTASRLAVRRFLRPERSLPSLRTRQFLATGTRLTFSLRNQRIAAWEWGDGPRVALAHGWSGVGGQLTSFVPALVAGGFSVVTWDAPGHGASEGHESSMITFGETLETVAASSGPLHGLIAHSFGAAGATYALSRGLKIDRVAFIGPPSRPSHWVGVYGRRIGLSDDAIVRLYDDLVRYVDSDWNALETIRLAPRQRTPLLVVHDNDDDFVPVRQGVELARAWPDADLMTTRGLGHWRILRDPAVIDRITSFITTPSWPLPGRVPLHVLQGGRP
jgi:pimeloyl-ACP methyl ester carboxylesterase